MNAKLEVIRMTNEDVIATSGLCKHLNEYDHVYVTNLQPMVCDVECYSRGDSLTSSGSLMPGNFKFKTAPEVNTWYYWNGTKYEKCEEQSNDAHPIVH